MVRRHEGNAAVYLLSGTLILLLLVGSLGLSETKGAVLLKTHASRALASALLSAARTEPADPAIVERTFRQVLAMHMGDVPYTATLAIVPEGSVDGISGQSFQVPALTARIEVPFRFEHLGQWLPTMRLRVIRTEFLQKKDVEA